MKESFTWRNAAKYFTLGQAVDMYKHNIATIITDGKDVTFEIEEPTSHQTK
mgnify:CR=1 FL=1|jgi:hypothetical protein